MANLNLSEWVKKARNAAGLTQEALADKLNMTKANVSAMENGRTTPSFINILEMATLAGIPLPHVEDNELTELSSVQKEDTIIIPEYQARAECGQGFDGNDDVANIAGGLPFSRKQLASLGIHEKDACIIYAMGDSMSPTIENGATVMLDLSQTTPIEGAVFAIIRTGNGTVIKRLRRGADRTWLYSSDNVDKNKYPDLFSFEEDRIIGRVVWQGGFNGL